MLQVDVKPFGPEPGAVAELPDLMLAHPLLRESLGRARHRLLGWELVEPETKAARPRSPSRWRWRATVYDYAKNRTLVLEDALRGVGRPTLRELGLQPVPSPDEFADALALVARHDELGPALREGRLVGYPPMPPLIRGDEVPGGGLERTLAVGLLPAEGERDHEIVGVNMTRQEVVRFDANSPFQAAAHNPICGLNYSGQATAAKGMAGQAWVTVSQGGTVLWRFLVVRPAASSGTNGSGVELRFVDYKGKRCCTAPTCRS